MSTISTAPAKLIPAKPYTKYREITVDMSPSAPSVAEQLTQQLGTEYRALLAHDDVIVYAKAEPAAGSTRELPNRRAHKAIDKARGFEGAMVYGDVVIMDCH